MFNFFKRNFKIIVLCILLVADIAQHTRSEADRRQLHQAEAIVEQNAIQNRRMLEARKEIQSRGVQALNRAKLWSEDDKRVISQNWAKAEYFGVDNPFPEYQTK